MERSSQYPTHELITRKDPMDPTDALFGGAGYAIGDKTPPPRPPSKVATELLEALSQLKLEVIAKFPKWHPRL